jgi:hypothetical protein
VVWLRAGGVAQVVENQLGKCKGLNLNPSTAKQTNSFIAACNPSTQEELKFETNLETK